MKKLDLWFGDSWTIGTDLFDEMYKIDKSVSPELHYQRLSKTGRFPHLTRDWSHPEYAYSGLTSKARGVDYKNFSFPGASIEFGLYNLLNFIKTEYNKDTEYTVFFCASGNIRSFFIDDLKKDHVHVHPYLQRETKESDHNFTEKKHKEQFYNEYNNTRTLNHVVMLCKQYNMKLHLIQTWEEIELHPFIDAFNLTTKFLFPRTLFEQTFGDEFYLIFDTEKDINVRYMNADHPNLKGHYYLHKKLMEFLDEN